VIGSGTGEKNPLSCRAILRLALLSDLINQPGGCVKVEEAFFELSASEKQMLQRELCKDGVLQHPACHLQSVHSWMTVACQKGPLKPPLQLLAAIFQEVGSEIANATLREPNVTLDCESFLPIAEALTPNSAPIDATAFTIERTGNLIRVQAHQL
jgi:hypothetical protein